MTVPFLASINPKGKRILIANTRPSLNFCLAAPYHRSVGYITIGIATGYVTVGLMGSSRFSTYTTLGSTTNLAARICDLATSGDTLVNERTYALAKEKFAFEPLEKTPIKGMAEPVLLYRVIPKTDNHDHS
jgi:class 3 adenylate cyclase